MKVCSRGHRFRAGRNRTVCPICYPGYYPEKRQKAAVTAYIAAAPRGARVKLKQMRAAIREVAPGSIERISYRLPCFEGVCWFGLMKNHIGLYIRPPVIEEHKHELAGYSTTISAVRFPLDSKLPLGLIKRLVRARIRIDKKK